MRTMLFSVTAAVALAFVALSPAQAKASWLSEALHAYLDRPAYYGDYDYTPPYYSYNDPAYYYTPAYPYAPYAGYYGYSYARPVPQYYRYGPRQPYWNEWREHRAHEWREHRR